MGNSLITATGLTKEALRVLHNEITFLKRCDKQYSKEFAVSGAKIGSTINVRLPNKYYVTHGTALKVQDTQESTTPLQLTTNFQIGLKFTQADLTLSMNDFSKSIIQPAMAKMAADMDMTSLSMTKDLFYQVGTPGTTPGTSGGSGLLVTTAPTIFLNAGAVLDSMAAPRDGNRTCLLNPFGQAGSVGGLSGLMQDSTAIAEQYRKGTMGTALGFEFAMDQNINSLTVGTRAGSHGAGGNFAVRGAGQTGSTLLADWTTDVMTGLTIAKGEIIEIAGVYSVNPENQQSTGMLAQFVVTSEVTISATDAEISIPIYPAIKLAADSVADGTVNTLPANDAKIRLVCSASATTAVASASFPMNLAYHKDAFTFATADLEKPNGVDFAAREMFDGISMLVVRQYDINSQQFPCRIDVLAGYASLRRELGCRITG